VALIRDNVTPLVADLYLADFLPFDNSPPPDTAAFTDTYFAFGEQRKQDERTVHAN